MPGRSPTFRPALLVFSFWVILFALILLDGYLLYLLRLPSDPAVILALVVVEFAALAPLALWLWPQRPTIHGDPLELAGFLLVTVGVWLYFVYPSWPTLLPPSHSGDGANHAAEINLVYTTAHLFGDYPAGPALLGATLAHWIGWSPLRLLHLSAALWVALTAGAIYGLACAMLPDRREYKALALCAPFALFISWGYFAGLLIDLSYFSPQALAQLFVVGFVWFLSEYVQADHTVWLIGMALCLIGIGVSFQLWLLLPLVLLAWILLGEWRKRAAPRGPIYRAVLIVAGSTVLFWLAILVAGRELIPNPSRLSIAGAAVLAPSVQELGGPLLIFPVLGLLFMLRQGRRARVVIAFAVLAALQTIALVFGNAWFGLSFYWMSKSFFLLIFPLALCAVVPVARLMEWGQAVLRRRILASPAAFLVVSIILGTATALVYPPPVFSPLSESDIQAALWAKEHLDTLHVNFISRKSLVASWLGVGIWDEHYPDDLFVDLATLGPKTFEEWRNDPDWGEYLFVSNKQQMPPDAAMRVIYQSGRSAILQKPGSGKPSALPETAMGSFGDVLGLVDYTRMPPALQAGDLISLTARIKTLSVPRSQVMWRLTVRDSASNTVAESLSEPFDNKFPLQRWPDGKVLTQPLEVTLPPDAAPGLDTVQLGLVSSESGPLPFESAANTQADWATLAGIKIPLPPLPAQELESMTHIDVQLGDSLELIGYRAQAGAPILPGGSLRITLYWRCLTPVAQNYTVFVHMVDSSGVVRAQQDSAPRAGSYPTSIWESGEIVPDEYTLTVPGNSLPGVYRIEVGMYDWPGLQRLVTKSGNTVLGNQVALPLQVTVARLP